MSTGPVYTLVSRHSGVVRVGPLNPERSRAAVPCPHLRWSVGLLLFLLQRRLPERRSVPEPGLSRPQLQLPAQRHRPS